MFFCHITCLLATLFMVSQLLKTFIQVDKKDTVSFRRYRSALKSMRITEERVAKVVKDRIFSAAFHPCTSSLLMAAGDKWGKVGLWKLVRFLCTVLNDVVNWYVTARGQEVGSKTNS